MTKKLIVVMMLIIVLASTSCFAATKELKFSVKKEALILRPYQFGDRTYENLQYANAWLRPLKTLIGGKFILRSNNARTIVAMLDNDEKIVVLFYCQSEIQAKWLDGKQVEVVE